MSAALVAFAREVIRAGWDYGGMDGGEIQDAAEKHGLLVPTQVTEPCSKEGCSCEEFDFPTTCYRFAPLLKDADKSVLDPTTYLIERPHGDSTQIGNERP
jgi:hypothetical protein